MEKKLVIDDDAKQMIFDSHAHYDDEMFDEDRDELLNGMRENGVGIIVDIGASIESSKRAFQLANEYKDVYCAVGVHPSDVDELTEETFKIVEEMLNGKKTVAVGEIGLDYHYEDTNEELQKYWFERQLNLAVSTDMPVIIHSRDAAADTMEILRKYTGKINRGVVHCYSYSAQMAKEYVDMGYYIGVGGVVTFKNAKKLVETVREVDLDKIVLETDCPYLAPEPFRGKRNNSTYIKYVVEKIAEIKGCSSQEVIAETTKNSMRLYGF